MGINWWAFVGVVLVAYLVPGPDFAVILRSATRGARTGVAAAVGAQLGLFVHMLLAVVGLSVLLARHPEVLTTIRVLGGAYLLYLGGRIVVLVGVRLAGLLDRARVRRWWDRATGAVLGGVLVLDRG